MTATVQAAGIELHPAGPAAATEVVTEACRYCPDLYAQLPAGLADAEAFSQALRDGLIEVHAGPVDFYEDYQLVRITWSTASSTSGPTASLLGFQAPGDFWPLDSRGRSITQLNRLAPRRLDRNGVACYARLRIEHELRLEPDERLVESSLLDVVPGALPLRWEELGGDLGKRVRDLLKPPKQLKAIEVSEEGTAYRLHLALLIEREQSARLACVTATVHEDGGIAARLRAQLALPLSAMSGRRTARPAILDRLHAPSPMRHWVQLRGGDYERWSRILSNLGVQPRMLRWSKLPFYRSFHLLEVLPDWPRDSRRSYALVRPGDSDVRYRIDGRSEVIHEVNELEDELVLDTDERVDAYLQFFCWALHFDGSPFLISNAFRELPFAVSPSDAWREQLRRLEWSVTRVEAADASARYFSETPASHARRRAIMAHGSHLFTVHMTVDRDAGMPTMVHDEPLELELEMLPPRFDQPGGLFVLPMPRQADSISPSTVDESPVVEPSSRSDSSTKEFLDEIEAWGTAVQRKVFGDLELNSPSATEAGGPAVVRECTFMGRVAVGSGRGWRFESCCFRQGFFARDGAILESMGFRNCRFAIEPPTMMQAQGNPVSDSKAQPVIQLASAVVQGDLILSRCRIQGPVLAASLRVAGSLRIVGCRIVSADREIREEYPITKSRLHDWVPLKRKAFEEPVENLVPALDLTRAFIGGDLTITADDAYWEAPLLGNPPCLPDRCVHEAAPGTPSVLGGKLTAAEIRVVGSTALFGTACLSDVDFHGGRLGGGLLLQCGGAGRLHAGSFLALGDVSLVGARIGTRLILSLARVFGAMVMSDSRIHGPVEAHGLHVGGDLVMSGARIGGEFTALRSGISVPPELREILRVGGDLVLTAARVRGVEVRAARVAGRILATGGVFGRLSITFGICSTTVDASLDGHWLARSSAQAIEFSNLTVTGDLELAGILLELPSDSELRLRLRQISPYGCSITRSRIGGDLRFFVGEPVRALGSRMELGSDEETRWARPTHVQHSSTDLLLLDAPSCRDLEASVWGGLDLRDNAIGGSLDIRNARVSGPIKLDATGVAGDMRLGVMYRELGFEWPGVVTHCTATEAVMMRCSGSVDFTGVRATEGLSARGARITGEFLLVPRSEVRARMEWLSGPVHVAIGGPAEQERSLPTWNAKFGASLDLTAVEAEHLLLSGANVEGATGASEVVVTLERGRFNRLEIVEPTPGPINLSGVKVGRWYFGRSSNGLADSAARDGTDKDYVAVLGRMIPFDRAIWVHVEMMLRNQARNEEADQVYVQMRRKQREEHSPATSQSLQGHLWRAWDRAQELTINYGTGVGRPMWVWLAMLALSAIVLSNPSNVRLSSSALQVVGPVEPSSQSEPAAGAASSPIAMGRLERTPTSMGERWAWLDGLALATRYHVPMAPINTHERWEAGRRVLPVGLTAEQYAGLVSVMSWIVWPIFLIGFGAKIFRGKQE